MVPAGRSASFTPAARDLGVAGVIGELEDRVGIRDIEILTDQHHAERRIQPADEDASGLGDAVAVAVAQQRDAVGARRCGASRLAEQFLRPSSDPLAIVRLRRRIAFRHQHVAVGQHIDRARMIEPGRERVHRHAARRRSACAPLGQPIAVATLMVGISDLCGAGKRRRGPVALLGSHRVLRVVAGRERQRQCADRSLPTRRFLRMVGSRKLLVQCGTCRNVLADGMNFM